jgi:hypothetical protein
VTFLQGEFVHWSGPCPIGGCGFRFQRTCHGAEDGWSKIGSDLRRHLAFTHGISGQRLETLTLTHEWARTKVTGNATARRRAREAQE